MPTLVVDKLDAGRWMFSDLSGLFQIFDVQILFLFLASHFQREMMSISFKISFRLGFSWQSFFMIPSCPFHPSKISKFGISHPFFSLRSNNSFKDI